MKRFSKLICLFIIISMILSITLIFTGCNKNVIRIGHKNYTEQRITGQLLKIMIEEHTEYKTDIRELGGTSILFEALKTNKVDVASEFTGSALEGILKVKYESDKSPQDIYDYVSEEYAKQFNIKWGEPFGYNNTYAIAVISDIVEEYELKTISDLVEISDELVFTGTAEFLIRQDGLIGLKEAYPGLNFKETISMDAGLRYQAIDNKEGQVTDAWTTDGRLQTMDVVLLEDDKQFFPPYYVAPTINGDFLKEKPEIMDILNRLSGQISEEDMIAMNYEVDINKRKCEDVAREFLKTKELI